MTNRMSLIILVLFFSTVILLPFSRLAELPILILSIIGISALIRKKVEIYSSRFKILSLVYFSYLIMILVSSTDSYWQQKTLLVGIASFRFFFAACAILTYIKKAHFKFLINLFAYFTILLSADALFQYFAGIDLIGKESYPGRLNGVFGKGHAKLGPLIALLFPLVLISLQDKKAWFRWLAVIIITISVILSGTRSAWIMLIFSITTYFFYHVKQKRIQLLFKSFLAASLLIITLLTFSADFQQRVDRSLALFKGSEKSIDFALANRLSIWESSINMINSHPINGVGAHGFRKAYPKFAEKDDFWQNQDGVGMHAHHWVLEVLSETGIIGFILFSFAIFKLLLFIKVHSKSPYTWAFSISLISAFLPITSTYSIFASFWSICIWIIGSGLILMSIDDD